MLTNKRAAAGSAFEAAPTAVVVVLAALQAWLERGSVAAGDWLLYAILAALVLAALATAPTLRRPSRAAVVAVGATLALAAWTGATALWSPHPALARDEGLLAAAYAVALAVPVLTLRSAVGRLTAVGAVAAGSGLLALATGVALAFGDGQLDAFPRNGRLYFPIGYVNAAAAAMLVGFWPAVAIAGRRRTPLALRAAAIGLAAAMVGALVLTQSRGGLAALALSALVVFAVVPARLRLALATALATAPAVLLFGRLTEGFHARDDGDAALTAAVVSAGEALLLAAAAGAVAGAAYAVLDRRLALPRRAVQAAGATAVLLVAGVAAVGVARFAGGDEGPRELLAERWEAFKQEPEQESSSHFLNPGSNRYDFWRVALGEFRDHPVGGAGARSFAPAYLVHGTSGETPARSHSLPLDVLAETGVVGLVLLLGGIGVPLVVAARRRALVPAAAALGGGVYWLAHASVDWTWTFPACGLPFFVLLGVALSEDGRKRLGGRRRAAIAAGAVVLCALAFAPPWLSARYLERGVAKGLPAGAADLDRARRLDPLAVDPYYAEASLAPGVAEALPPLRTAAAKEPRSVRAQYLLGLALLEAGRKAEARERLLQAKLLFPSEPLIDDALARTR